MVEEHNKDESEKTEEKANEEIKKSRIGIVASAKSIRIQDLFLKLWKMVKTLWEAIKKDPLAYLSIFLIFANLMLAYYGCRADSRAKKLFIGQNKPLIDVTPIGIVQVERKDEKKTKMCVTLFSIVNYSGFDAYNIAFDIKYGSDWISEWGKAENNRKEKVKIKAEDNGKETVEKRVMLNHLYTSRPNALIPKLMSGETKGRDFKLPPFVSGELYLKSPPFASGEFDLEVNVVAKNEGFPILVRVTWENESGYVFDEIHKYKLLCTESGSGLSFTFIPEGIKSQKN
jgi:hypothetical protein